MLERQAERNIDELLNDLKLEKNKNSDLEIEIKGKEDM
jgi:transcriptional regulator